MECLEHANSKALFHDVSQDSLTGMNTAGFEVLETSSVTYCWSCRWPLHVLLASLASFFPRGGSQSVFIEYVMLKGINDSLLDAARLVSLLQPIECKLNLIGFNSHHGSRFQPSSQHQMYEFRCTIYMYPPWHTSYKRAPQAVIEIPSKSLVSIRQDPSHQWHIVLVILVFKACIPNLGQIL